MDIEKIYNETKNELEQLNTQQAVRLEKIKQLAGEFGFVVDNTLTQKVTAKKAELEKEHTQLETELESLVTELEKTYTNE